VPRLFRKFINYTKSKIAHLKAISIQLPLRQQFIQKLALHRQTKTVHLLVLAVETNIFNVFCKPDLWQNINEAILLLFQQKSPLLSYKSVSIQSSI